MRQLGALFLRVCTVSAGCSVVLALLLALLPKLRAKVAARSLYVLFLVLALRLLLPVEVRLPAPAVTVPTLDYTVSVPVPRLTPAEPNAGQVQPVLDPVVSPEAAPARPVRKIPVLHILGLIWALGAAGCALFSAGGFLLARRRLLKGSVPADMDLEPLRRELGVKRPVRQVRLVYSAAAPCPLALGLLRPVIVLPAGQSQVDELVLRHELTHIRRWDVAYKLVLSLACWVNWFNPLVWLMDQAAGQNLELCCDDEVTRDLTDAERRRYGNLLLDAASAQIIPFSTCFSGGKSQMKERLLNLFTHKRNSAALVSLVLAAAMLAGGLVACETGQLSAWSTQLLEFPGTHWNDTPEAVLEALGITQEQITADETYTWEDMQANAIRTIAADHIACFGGTANVLLRFVQHLADSPFGLFRVELRFPDGTDMGAVKAKMTELYGAGSQEEPYTYDLRDGEVSPINPHQSGTMTVSWLPDQELFTYRLSPNEHKEYWVARGRDLIPEELDEAAFAAALVSVGNARSEEVVSQLLEQMTLAGASWTDAYVLEDGSLKENNVVILGGADYVYLRQNGYAATPSSSRLSEDGAENEARRVLLKDYFYQNFTEDNASVVFTDLTGDGLDEMLVLTMSTTDGKEANLRQPVNVGSFAYGQLSVCGVKNGAAFQYNLSADVYDSHAGWGYEYLVPRSDGNGFALLDFRPYLAQGSASYAYSVNVLDEESESWVSLDSGEVFFSTDPVEALGPDTGGEATLEEVQAFLDRVQAYRDSGAALLAYNVSYGGSTGGPEFSYLNASPADVFNAEGAQTISGLREYVVSDGEPVQLPLPPAGPATPEEALDRLEASVQAYPDGYVFRIPNYDGEWIIHIAGRMRMGDEGSEDFMSVHYLENEEWTPGKRYSFDTGEGAYFSELNLDAWVTGPDGTQAERTIKLVGPQNEVDSDLPNGEGE